MNTELVTSKSLSAIFWVGDAKLALGYEFVDTFADSGTRVVHGAAVMVGIAFGL